MEFINGKAVIKKGRTIVAKVYNRPVFYKGTIYESNFDKDFPFAVFITGLSTKECRDLSEVENVLNKWV